MKEIYKREDCALLLSDADSRNKADTGALDGQKEGDSRYWEKKKQRRGRSKQMTR